MRRLSVPIAFLALAALSGEAAAAPPSPPALDAPPLAVIPTVIVGGPLALLAMLFPTWFGGWKRWLALLSIAATNSTLYTLHWWFADRLAGSWWGRPLALWAAMGVVNVLGLGWAWQRHLRRVETGDAPLAPGLAEVLVLALSCLIGAAALAGLRYNDQALLKPEWLPVVAFVAALTLGAAVVAWQWLRGPRLVPALSSEAVVLTGLALTSVVLGTAIAPATSGADTDRVTQAWAFRAPGAIHSTPLLLGDRAYVTVDEGGVLGSRGALYCLDRATGAVAWRFDDGGAMRSGFSSPVADGGRLYFGEGLHTDYHCKLYCLDAATGQKLWDFPTGNHTESTPTVVAGRVYVGAGDDGLYCLDAATGKKVWNFPGFHFDSEPAVTGGRVYAGCGVGDAFRTTMMFCLDAATGRLVWRVPTEQPVWGRALVSDGRVYFGTGAGRVTDAEAGAGSVFCVNAADGQVVWRQKMPGGVMAAPAADAGHLYFGCRDGSVYCLDRDDGSRVWRRKMGGPVVSGVVLAYDATTGAATLHAAAFHGLLAALDASTGELLWGVDLARKAGAPVEVLATPVVESHGEGAQAVRRVYAGLTIVSTSRVGELHCYEGAAR